MTKIKQFNKVITVSIDTAQENFDGYVVGRLVDFLTLLFQMLGLEVFINTTDEYYEDDSDG